MQTQKIAEFLFSNAQSLIDSVNESSNKYTINLGYWAIKKEKIESLKKELKLTTSEFKAYDLDKKEFPTLDEHFFELEVRTDSKNKKKVSEILKKLEAFEIEKFHIANLNERVRRVNSAFSSFAKRLFVKNKNNNPWSKNNIVKILKHIGAENITTEDHNEGKTSFKFSLNDVPMYAISSEKYEIAVASYNELKTLPIETKS